MKMLTLRDYDYKAPMPYFGGKRRIAAQVWQRLGNVKNYVEPFFGSGAVLLARPHAPQIETVNDADAYLANFWRALQHDPDGVAAYADWMVNEVDLVARNRYLIGHPDALAFRERMFADPDIYDVKLAGWWVWGINSWIGSGWCVGNGPWGIVNGKVQKNGGKGGQWRQLPHLGDAGQGVNRQLPHLGNAGQGVNRKLPHLGWPPETKFGSVHTDPYSGDVRTKDLYATDNHDIATQVREWAIAHGDDRRLRIALCGYAAEFAGGMPANWREYAYSAGKSYGTTASVGSGKGNDANRHNERIWFSPGCLTDNNQKPKIRQSKLTI